jgi:transcriptional regulator with XRE-family HTH domain
MASITQRFGERVKKLRTQRKMSQLELSQKAQLDLTTINEIENGNREPMLRTIWRVSNALNVSLSKLFDF